MPLTEPQKRAVKAAGSKLPFTKAKLSTPKAKFGMASLVGSQALDLIDGIAGQPVAPPELYDALGVAGWATAPAMMYAMNEAMGGNPAGNPELDYRAGDPNEMYDRRQLLRDNSAVLEQAGRVLPLNSPRRMQILHSMYGGGGRSIGNMIRPSAVSTNPYQMELAAPHQVGRDWEKYYAEVYGTGRK